jgi:hypothetical protein
MTLILRSMLYHTIIVHLFRPMLKVDLVHSDVQPREICVEAANNVSDIVRLYRRFYDFRVAHLAIPHILLSVCIVHLLYSKNNGVSYQNLVEGLQGLEDLHECHYFGARSFRILHTLATTWNLSWPEELRKSKLLTRNSRSNPQDTASPQTDPLLVAPNTFTTTGNHIGSNLTYSPAGHSGRRESLSMFAPQVSLQLASHPAITRPGSVPAIHHQSSTVGHTSIHSFDSSPYQFSQPMSSVAPNATATVTSPTTNTAETLFWNPIPGMPGPILPRSTYQQISPMGLSSVLQTTEMGDRLGRDGFKMSEDWQSSHVNGFTSTSNNGFSGQNSQSAGTGYMHRGSASYPQPSEGVQYQQQQQHHHNAQSGPQEDYNGVWYSNQMN